VTAIAIKAVSYMIDIGSRQWPLPLPFRQKAYSEICRYIQVNREVLNWHSLQFKKVVQVSMTSVA
jgi:hypothetical protein